MTPREKRITRLAREQLDRRLDSIRESSAALEPPRGGWIHAIRTAYGMTQANLAARMGMSRQAVGDLEGREGDGGVTLNALEQAAEALGGRLVYAIVPDHSISQALERRAVEMAGRMMGSVRHSMKLEDQEPLSSLDEPTWELARDLLASPGRLWSEPDGG